jgi:hypothetical protein
LLLKNAADFKILKETVLSCRKELLVGNQVQEQLMPLVFIKITENAFRVISGDFLILDGTGMVYITLVLMMLK